VEIELEKNVILAIATAREKRGLTQKQLAEMCGLSQSVIARLERSSLITAIELNILRRQS
jgi:ribosome-binding protein aMBF1 (putative translation factor)